MKTVEYDVIGTSPLMQHNPASMSIGVSSGLHAKRKIPTPAEEAEAGLYRSGKLLYHPASGLRSSLIDGADGFKVGNSRKNVSTVLKSVLFLHPDMQTDETSGEPICVLVDPLTKKPLKDTDWTIDTRRVVLTGSVMRSRPKFRVWQTRVVFEYDERFIDVKELDEVFSRAGQICGIGELRPKPPSAKGKGGGLGRYRIERV